VQAPEVVVHWYGDTGLDVSIHVAGIELANESTKAGEFVQVTCPETPIAGEPGAPALPVVRRLFGVPEGAAVDLSVQESESSIVALSSLGFTEPVIPMQRPISLDSQAIERASADSEYKIHDSLLPFVSSDFRWHKSSYSEDAFSPTEAVTITRLGIARRTVLYLLEARPVSYNPVRGQIMVQPEVHVRLRFRGGEGFPVNLAPVSGMHTAVLNPARHTKQRDGELGNYLIVTAEDFAGSAPLIQFADAKTAQGFDVTTYTAVSGTDKTAIKAYIQSLWDTPDAPDYLLLVGDALRWATTAGPYSIPVWAGLPPVQGATDNDYACMDGGDDWYPDMALGRIPVRLVSELQDVVDKILYVDGGDYDDPGYAERALFISGEDSYSGGRELHLDMIDTYMTPGGIESTEVCAAEGGTTQDVIDAFNIGTSLVAFFGHAAGYQKWGSPLFDFDDIEGLTNDGMFPFIMTFSCSGGAFHLIEEESSPGFLEKWLLVPGKGAAAGYGTSRLETPYGWSAWQNLYTFLFRAMYDDDIRELGPACQAAAGYFIAYYGPDDPVSRDWTECFKLLGDPSMRMPEPPADNYLVVAAESYVGGAALSQFIAAKEAMGFVVSAYSVPSGTSNTAIKSYIETLWGTPDAPDYVLLVGDTDGFSSTASTIPHWEGDGTEQAVTDLPYVCMDGVGDWYPDMPIGRFSVRTETQLQAIVDKSLFVEAGVFSDPDYVKRGAFVASAGTLGTAEPAHEFVIENYFEPNDYSAVRVYSSQGGGTQDIMDAVNSGCLFTAYFGHSSASGWWDPAFSSTNVNALANTGLYGLVLGWSCNTAHFDYDECFGETWLRAGNKGAAAYIAASDYVDSGTAEEWGSCAMLEGAFFAAVFEDNIWEVGSAWQRGLYRFLEEYGDWDGDPQHPPQQNEIVIRNFFEEFVLLGDPALRLPQPTRFTLSSFPTMLDLCCPPSDQAVYVVDVRGTGGFDEIVTLSASGLPTGATLEFDENIQAPPFNAMMAVGNLAGADPGVYDIEVVGTSASMQQSLFVELTIANEYPADVVLDSPADDAIDVALTPQLTWMPSWAATRYEVQLASDLGFGDIVFSDTVIDTSVLVDVALELYTEYYWHVRSINGCKTSEYSATFSFTTTDEIDYFTEEFTGDRALFDLDGRTLALIPDGSGDYYSVCILPAKVLPTDPKGGTNLSVLNNGSQQITLPFDFPIYGLYSDTCYVNANGNISFTSSDATAQESLEGHFAQPRISALFDDLNPESGGTVSWKDIGVGVAVTWQNVPEYAAGGSNTFQIEMFVTGEVRITWLGVDSSDSIVGISQGFGLPDDYADLDLSESEACTEPAIGACCEDETCTVMTELECVAVEGEYVGNDTGCDPNPCLPYNSSCLIISEVVQGAESGDCPRWIEITNTGPADYVFFEGGVIVQTGDSTDIEIDVDLTGKTIVAGESFVINSNFGGQCTGAFGGIYGISADMDTNVPFGYGNERLILTDTHTASHFVDSYGVFGVDGTGEPWEFTQGYSRRESEWNSGAGLGFAQDEWQLGGVGSLAGENPTELLQTLTTPGTHLYDETCILRIPGDLDGDDDVDLDDFVLFVDCLTGPSGGVLEGCEDADLDGDNDVDLVDFIEFMEAISGS